MGEIAAGVNRDFPVVSSPREGSGEKGPERAADGRAASGGVSPLESLDGREERRPLPAFPAWIPAWIHSLLAACDESDGEASGCAAGHLEPTSPS
jgi:hypothetical protein